jgi:hypothetical protein
MTTSSKFGSHTLLVRLVSQARALSAVVAVTALAAMFSPNSAVAGPFAVTTLNPNSQTAAVGTPFSVDVVFAVGSAQYGQTYGIEAWLAFDPNILQVASISNGSSSPFTTVGTNTFNNALGILDFQASGGLVSNRSFTAFTINFNPIAEGTSAINFQNVNQYFNGYGPFGVNGGSVNGSVTVQAGSASSVPDAASTLAMLGAGLVALGAIRRKMFRA